MDRGLPSRAGAAMKKPSSQTLILGNATRLLNDARLLVENGRFASAFALAVLGIEEIGKALIDGWATDAPLAKSKFASLHIQKQSAVASLLVGAFAIRAIHGGSIADLEGERLTALTRKFNESDAGRLFWLIREQELDKRKQNALYQDDFLSNVADDFAEEHVDAIFQIASDATDVITDRHIRVAGRAFYVVSG
jgi:AbiV family abortive infection protein